MTVLVTGANGMFGSALIRHLSRAGIKTKAMVRNIDKAEHIRLPNIEIVLGDMEKPETLNKVFTGIDKIFLISPMIPTLDRLEINVIKAACLNNVKHILKIHGAVEHNDFLGGLHNKSIAFLKKSGLFWTLISPNSVMETSLFPFIESIKEENTIWGCSGKGKVGHVALDDIAAATAHVISTDEHSGKNYKLTGPESLDLYEVADCFTKVLGKKIIYNNMSVDEFEEMLIDYTGMTKEQLDIEIMCHLKAWKENRANLITTTFEELTALKPTSLTVWIEKHKKMFN